MGCGRPILSLKKKGFLNRSGPIYLVVGKVREGGGHVGFNAATEKYEDLVQRGVTDPAKVTRTALQNAASIAGLMLTTEAMIADVQDDKGGDPMGGMGGGMGMGM